MDGKNKSELQYTEQGWRYDTDMSRHHHERHWNYKGRGIYHITIVVAERFHLFGELAGDSPEKAYIALNDFGAEVNRTLHDLPSFYASKGIAIKMLAIKVMPDHVHFVIQVLEPMPKTIGEIVRSFKSTCTSLYKRTYLPTEPALNNERGINNQNGQGAYDTSLNNEREMNNQNGQGAYDTSLNNEREINNQNGQGAYDTSLNNEREINNQGNTTAGEPMAGNLSGQRREMLQDAAVVHFAHIFMRNDRQGNRSKTPSPSIWQQLPVGYHERVLHCEGQLDAMINYVKDNPRRLWLKHANPQLFEMRRDVQVGKWCFRAMGNMFLLDFPYLQYIQCSRSITDEQLQTQLQQQTERAEDGYVSVSACISKGEQLISRTLRQAGMPLIVLLKDGFPQEGSEKERHYKPGGAYFEACAAGRLLLLEPKAEVLQDEDIATAVYRKDPWAKQGSQRYAFLALNHIAMTLTALNNERAMNNSHTQ